MTCVILQVLSFLLLCVEALTGQVKLTQFKGGKGDPQKVQPQDCMAILKANPWAKSGVYVIKPAGCMKECKVYCEMRPDGGWIVFHRRSGGGVSFDRKWEDYETGFGTPAGDHWLGLKSLSLLTRLTGRKFILRVELHDFHGKSAYAEYRDFSVGDQQSNYKLHAGTYSGTAGDAIHGLNSKGQPIYGPGSRQDQSGFGFSCKDRDNDGCYPYCVFGDIAESSCSNKDGGGWWFSRCGFANLHGKWHPAGENIGWASGLHWHTWKKPAPYSLKATIMMLRPEH